MERPDSSLPLPSLPASAPSRRRWVLSRGSAAALCVLILIGLGWGASVQWTAGCHSRPLCGFPGDFRLDAQSQHNSGKWNHFFYLFKMGAMARSLRIEKALVWGTEFFYVREFVPHLSKESGKDTVSCSPQYGEGLPTLDWDRRVIACFKHQQTNGVSDRFNGAKEARNVVPDNPEVISRDRES